MINDTKLPLYWMNEQSGQLSAALENFNEYLIEPWEEDLSDREHRLRIFLIKWYLNQWISADCWRGTFKDLSILDELIKLSELAANYEELSLVLAAMLKMDVDPF